MECWSRWEPPSEILPSPRGWPRGLVDGMMVGVVTVFITVLLELLSFDAVRRIVREDATLYRQAVVANLSNNLLLGPLIYCGGVNLFAARETPSSAESLAVGVCMTLGHAVGYYAAHRAMHTKRLFWMHAFHHRFNVLVCPMAANAVTWWEYSDRVPDFRASASSPLFFPRS